MKWIRQIIILLLMVVLGEILNKVFKIPIPGNIMGMILMLLALQTGLVKLDQVEGISKFLLNHLAILFIPAGVGLLAVTGMLKESWHILVFIAIVTTILVMVMTAWVVHALRRWMT
ncbi:CidA/LrgA family protein [Petrocella sp. FN5]|uniref:CidA/LrgA family protein n=1 Tax=Petrocella sp. FN5 TaxID=3032002 RepID=UPI0023DBFD1D|nr:CidA/LrgA family protein [Petrocella sp. FN5]MDF1616748.1 CidA/LrgA family protein [Petrocella sp. FN5]